MKLSIKFGAIISVIVMTIGVLAFLTTGSLKNIEEVTKEHQEVNAKLIITSLNLQKDIIEIQQWLTDVSATKGKPGYDDGFELAKQKLEDAKIKIGELEKLGAPKPVLDPIKTDLDVFYAMGVKMANTYIKDGTDAGNEYMGEFDPFANKMEEEIDGLLKGANGKFALGNTEINRQIEEMTRNSTILFSLVILVCLFSILAIHKLVINPIDKITNHSLKLANLEFSEDVPSKLLKRKDEVGKMAGALQDITVNVRGVIGSVKDSSEQVASSAEELTATVQQSTASVEEVSRAIEEIASSSSKQATSTEEGSDKAVMLGEIIEKDHEYLRDLNVVTDKIKSSVDEGLDNIERIVAISKESSIATHEVQDGINKTNESAKKIGEVSSLIASIAEQTNLLALNAAIEAARAGEAGRGFAVVAEEVRQLAEKSRVSTNDIDNIIKELQKNSSSAVKTMEKVAVILKEQIESVDSSKKKFLSIREVIKEAKQTVENMNDSGTEMETMKSDILRTLQNLAMIAEENSSETQQVSASVEEQTASMEEISNSSEGLARLANDLQSAVSRFKV